MNASRLTCLLAAAMSIPAFAGCLADGADLTTDEAPLGPRSLRVGTSTLGEFVRIAHNLSGHRVSFEYTDGDFDTSIEPYEDHNYVERSTSENLTLKDAFGRPFTGVITSYRITDLDPERNDLPTYEARQAWEPPANKLHFYDLQYVITSCSQGQCTQDVRNARQYPRDEYRTDEEWASLEGKVLTLGKVTSLNRTLSYSDGEGGTIKYRLFANFTPIRETKIDGVRAFQVIPTMGFQRLTPASDVGSDPDEPDPDDPFSKKPKTPMPRPVHHLWVTSRLGIPVKEDAHYPFSYDGNWYWRNWTRVVDVHHAGNGTVGWGKGEALPAIERLPGVQPVNGYEFFAQAGSRLTHNLKEAWDALRADATQMRFQDYMKAHPQALPFRGTYFPDPAHGAYTWNLYVDDGTDQLLRADSRFQAIGPQQDVGIVQNRVPSAIFSGMWMAPNETMWKGSSLVGFQDIYKAYEASWPVLREPGSTFYFQRSWSNPDNMTASLAFFRPNILPPTGVNLVSQNTIWRAAESVAYNVHDGGLLGLNLTFASGSSEWPWNPLSNPIVAAAGLGAALDPGALAAADVPALPWWGEAGFASPRVYEGPASEAARTHNR